MRAELILTAVVSACVVFLGVLACLFAEHGRGTDGLVLAVFAGVALLIQVTAVVLLYKDRLEGSTEDDSINDRTSGDRAWQSR